MYALLAAFIWGTAFSAQSVGARYLGPFAFNTLRSAVAVAALFLLDCVAARLVPGRKGIFSLDGGEKRRLLLAGSCCGLALTAASFSQQFGIGAGVSAGKAGFITAMYIVIVPLLGLLRGRRPGAVLWGAVALAVAGLSFLCVEEGFSVAPGDLSVLLCAFLFSLHILVIDRFSGAVDGIQMSCVQFLVAALLSGVGMAVFEPGTVHNAAHCLGAVFYAGFFSSGVGYTLQILAQKDANPTVVSLLLSLESVFAALGGAVLLRQSMEGREILGCVLMLAAVTLAQLPRANPGGGGEAGAGPGNRETGGGSH